MVASTQPVASEPPAWDSMSHSTGYHPPPPTAPAPTLLPKTVDYGHGHGRTGGIGPYIHIQEFCTF